MQRIFDIIFSIFGLTLSLPFFIPIMIILKLTGEHEIFYLQNRVGKGGNLFKIIKFASMMKNSVNCGAGLFTLKDDPRVFAFGRFLRKTKLNEIPQLINVLLGDMSFVGPRPQVPAHFELYSEHVKKEIVNVQPGLTGIGSIIFRNEEDLLSHQNSSYDEYYKNIIVPYKGDIELWYIKNNNSLQLYFLIIFITIWVVFFSKSKVYLKLFKDLPQPPHEIMDRL